MSSYKIWSFCKYILINDNYIIGICLFLDIKTTAVRDGDDLIINGSKMWITNASHADYICLLANTNKGPVHKSKSLIIVPMNLPGMSLLL